MFPFDDFLECLDSILPGNIFSRASRKNLRHKEGLGEEPLNPARPAHNTFVVIGQFVHTQNRNDILKILVFLERFLNGSGHTVMLLPDNHRVKNTGCRIEGIDSGVNAKLRDLARQNNRGIQVGKGCRGSGIRQVIGRDIHSLNGRDRPFLGGGDAFLEPPHFDGQGWLISDGRWHASQKSRNFRTSKSKPEYIVDEEQDVPSFFIAEILRLGQTGQRDTQTNTRRFIHLSIDKTGLVYDFGLFHFVPEVVSLAGSFPDAGKHGKTTVFHGNIPDELHNDNCFAHSGSAEKACFSSLCKRSNQIDNLDSRFEDFGCTCKLFKTGRLAVDGSSGFRRNWSGFVHRISKNIHHPTQDRLSDRNLDW